MSEFKFGSKEPMKIGFFLIENFTMLALASALEPLRMANQLSGEELYSWTLIGSTTDLVTASDGIQISPDKTIADVANYDLVFVVSGINVMESHQPQEIRWLRTLVGRVRLLGGLCTGSYLLAKAGLLDGYSCSAHWECLAALQEEYPLVYCNNHLFSFDRDRITCTGGDVPMHMVMHLISMNHGANLANAISDMFVCERIRDSKEPQRVRLSAPNFVNQPKLSEALQLMEANVEEPIELKEIADLVGISRRHLERLFLAYLNCSPSRFYLKLRLERARQLLTQTPLSIVEISAVCGFISAPHFSRSYRKHMGRSPKAERDLRRKPSSNMMLLEESSGQIGTNSGLSLGKAMSESSFGSVLAIDN
mgnify:CR=1 FL=1